MQLSKQAVRWLFKPVKKGTYAAIRYKGLDAKVPCKDNSGRTYEGNSHFILSCVKLRREFAEAFKSVTCLFSII